MAQSPEEMAASMIANLKEKTGKALPDWLKILKKESFEKHGEIVQFLKKEHGMGHGFANLVAHEFRNATAKESDVPQDLVAAQYAGAKADLRPIHDAIVKAVAKFGKDVEFAAKKTYVSLRRSKQFGLIQPSTKTRVDLGLNLKGEPETERLEASGSFNAMVSHRVRLTAVEQVDAELIGWLRQAYERA